MPSEPLPLVEVASPVPVPPPPEPLFAMGAEEPDLFTDVPPPSPPMELPPNPTELP